MLLRFSNFWNSIIRKYTPTFYYIPNNYSVKSLKHPCNFSNCENCPFNK